MSEERANPGRALSVLSWCALLLLSSVAVGLAQPTADDSLTLWFDEPAEKWLEAFPLGNGRIGGMVFGGIKEERIGLNEESLWAGQPVDNIPPQVREHLDEIRRAIFNESTIRFASCSGNTWPRGLHLSGPFNHSGR